MLTYILRHTQLHLTPPGVNYPHQRSMTETTLWEDGTTTVPELANYVLLSATDPELSKKFTQVYKTLHSGPIFP